MNLKKKSMIVIFLVMVTLGTSVYVYSQDWPLFRQDLSNTGYSSSNGPLKGDFLWDYTTGDEVYSSPTVADGNVYVGSNDNYVYCLDADTGTWVWDYQIGGAVHSSPAVADGKVYIGSGNCLVYCLDADNGDWIWECPTGDDVFSSPAVADDKVYVGSTDYDVYCLDADTGDWIWIYDTGGEVYSSPAVVDGKVYVGSNDNYVYCLDADTGDLIWKFLTSDEVFSSPAVVDGKVYVGSTDYAVYCLDADTGDWIWIYQTGGAVHSSPAVADGKVYIGSGNGLVYCLDADNGDWIWECPTGVNVFSSPAVADDKVYVGSFNGKVYCLDADTGSRIWIYQTGGEVYSSPAVVDGKVYVGSFDYKIYCLGISLLRALDQKMTLNVVSGSRGSQYFTYYMHLTQWPDGALIDTLDPSVTWRIGINEEILEAHEYQIQPMTPGLCKLIIDRNSVPTGPNIVFIEAENHGVKVSTIEEISNTRAEIVNIGVILPSDDRYTTASPVIELAKTHINEYCSNLGYDVSFEFLVEDADGSIEGHLEKVESFHNYGVDLVIGGFWSSQAAGSLDYLNENDMIMFSPSSTSHNLAIPGDNFFRLISDDTLQAKAIATLLEKQGVDSIIVMQLDWSHFDRVTDALEREFADHGGLMYPIIVYPYEAVNNLEFDFTEYLIQAEALADAVPRGEKAAVVILGRDETAQIMNQAYADRRSYRDLNELDWYGWQLTPFSTIESHARDAAIKYGMASTLAAPTKSEKWHNFVHELGYEPIFFDACLYDICWIYAKSVLEASSIRTENIKPIMLDVTNQYFGVSGWCNLNDDGDRYPVDYDIMRFDEVFGWQKIGRYDKIAEMIFEK